jgi:AcrR family transcriptional regulator/DNA-binding MarR family transcriptional regulator
VAGETASVAEDGLKRSQVASVQRSRILAATFQACAERGAAGLSVADVVERAGISRRTFYELFDSSEDCLLAALDHAIALAGERALAAYDLDAPWRRRMRASLTALLRFLDEQPQMARLLVVESLAAGPRAFERRARALAPVAAAIDEGHRAARKGAEPPPLTAEGIVGGVLAVLHRRILEGAPRSTRSGAPAASGPRVSPLLNELMGMVVLPYLGAAAAHAELEQPLPKPPPKTPPGPDALARLNMRFTYRTMRVLQTIAEQPGASNRQVGRVAGIDDPGQISKLLARLQKIGLIENAATPQEKGAPNAWALTSKGAEIQRTIAAQA